MQNDKLEKTTATCIQIQTWLEGKETERNLLYAVWKEKEELEVPVNYTVFTTCFAGAQ